MGIDNHEEKRSDKDLALEMATDVIERIEKLRPEGVPRGDLAYEVSVHLENYATNEI